MCICCTNRVALHHRPIESRNCLELPLEQISQVGIFSVNGVSDGFESVLGRRVGNRQRAIELASANDDKRGRIQFMQDKRGRIQFMQEIKGNQCVAYGIRKDKSHILDPSPLGLGPIKRIQIMLDNF
jgi:hypothetical protein